MSTFRKYIALIDALSKALKIFELQKSRFFIKVGQINFYRKLKAQIKAGVQI
jgi:hypothetical protein